MALMTTGTGGLAAEMKTFYDRLLLVRTVPSLLYSKFAQKRGIPKNKGKIIEFRRFGALAPAITPLVEGSLFTDLKELSVTAITATIDQYGDAVGFSDIVSTTTIDPILTETVEIQAEEAAESIDEIVRAVVVAGTTLQYGGVATSLGTITAGITLNAAEVREAVLTLKINRAKKIDGFYHCILHPRSAHDLQGTTEWVEANQFAGSQRIFDGSLGTLYGVKFWESDKARVLVNGGSAGTVDVYSSMFFGANAYGVVSLAGHNLRTIFKKLGSAGTADPLDQQQTMGWKVAFVAKILNDAFMVRVEHATSTGAN